MQVAVFLDIMNIMIVTSPAHLLSTDGLIFILQVSLQQGMKYPHVRFS
jgi:hypothetical protein